MNSAGEPTFPQTPPFADNASLINGFSRFCAVDLQLSKWTIKTYTWKITQFLNWLGKSATHATVEDIRQYLEEAKSKYSPKNYINVLIALRRFCRDFLHRPELVESFAFPSIPFNPPHMPSKDELQRFFSVLQNYRQKAMFLTYASSGLRCSEVLNLRRSDIDFTTHRISPRPHLTARTKRSPQFTFFNAEAAEYLAKYLETRHDSDPRLFKVGLNAFRRSWKRAMKRARVKVYPQDLRQWFCQTLTEANVSD